MQLSLRLPTAEPFSSFFFVPHSGLSDAIEVLDKVVEDVTLDPRTYRSVFVYGDKGSGKTHLLSIFKKRLEDLERNVLMFDSDTLTTKEPVSKFVSEVEGFKLKGGVILIEGSSLAVCEIKELAPHVNSRVLGGYTVRVSQPLERELRPLILALLEKRGLRFTEYSIEHLIKHLPAKVDNFESIIRAIDELTLRERQRITRGVIVDALKGVN